MMKASSSAKIKKLENISFEKALEMIDEIILNMESQVLPLDQILEKYEQGVQLIEHCQNKLSIAENRVTLLTKKQSDLQAVSGLPLDANETRVEEVTEEIEEKEEDMEFKSEPPSLF